MTGNRSGDSDTDTSEDKKDVESSLENEAGDNQNSGMICFQRRFRSISLVLRDIDLSLEH